MRLWGVKRRRAEAVAPAGEAQQSNLPQRDPDHTDVAWRQRDARFGTDPDGTDGRARYGVALPNAALREASSLSDLGAWYAIGEAWADVAAAFVPQVACPQIVDIGCGCGKMARFFVVDPRIRYLGLDVFRPAVEWCQGAFSVAYGERFTFVHLDLYSKLYNRTGAPVTAETRLPIADSSSHLIMCASLFTHLLEDEMHVYLREISRGLAPGGRLLASIHNEPEPGKPFSGAVERIDMSEDYFLRSGANVGLHLVERLGAIYGQEAFILQRG